MPYTAGSVMLRAAVHLNDPSQLVYTSTVLLPYLNIALNDLEEEMGVYELAPLRKEAIVIDVDDGDIVLDQMPADFVESISLHERNRDSSEEWREIQEVSWPDINLTVSPATEILQWAARGTLISITPPSTDREVLLTYIRGLVAATATSTAIDVEAARGFLAVRTAQVAARDAGNSITKYNALEPDVARSRDRVIRRLQKNQQEVSGVRRRPYRGRSF